MDYICTNSPTQDKFGLTEIGIHEIGKMLKDKPVLGIDTETTGLKFLDDTLLMVQIFDGENNFVIDARTIDWAPVIKPFFEDPNVVKIAHNMKFDYKFIFTAGIRIENAYDTMLVEKVINGGKKGLRFGLKNLMHKYFDIEMQKEVRNTFVGHRGDFTKAQVVYGLGDTEKLLEIRELQMTQVNELKLRNVVNLENNAVLAFADIEYNGLFLDKDSWENTAIAVKENIETLFTQVEDILYDEFPEYRENQIDMFGEGRLNTLNWASPKQVLAFMQKIDHTLDSVGAPALKPITHKHAIIAKYVEFKEKSKLYNAYGPDFYKYLHSDGKVHTSFDQILDTGRVSSRGPNMQQIPADNTYRNAFIPKELDYVFVSSDFSAQELCIIAFGSQDPVWLSVLKKGGDLHSVCAELIFGEQWTSLGSTNDERKNTSAGKKLRTHVKTINFGLAYGMGAYSLSNSLGISESDAKALIKLYYKTFPRIEKFLKGLGNTGRKEGSIRTFAPFNRVRYFEGWNGNNTPKSEMAKIERASKNTPIQGTGADMTKYAMIKIRKLIHKHTYPVQVVMVVHDEVNTIVQKDFAEQWATILSKVMEESAEVILGKGLLKSEAEITAKWQK